MSAPTAMLAAAGHLCLGGAAGGIACIPLAALHRGSAEGAFELRDAGGMGRRLTSLFGRYAAEAELWLVRELSEARVKLAWG